MMCALLLVVVVMITTAKFKAIVSFRQKRIELHFLRPPQFALCFLNSGFDDGSGGKFSRGRREKKERGGKMAKRRLPQCLGHELDSNFEGIDSFVSVLARFAFVTIAFQFSMDDDGDGRYWQQCLCLLEV